MLAFLLSISAEEKRSEIKRLYEKYHGDMVIVAKTLLRAKECSDVDFFAYDAVQNAFLKLITYIDKINFNATEKQLRGYLFSTLENEVRLLIKKDNAAESLDCYINEIDDSFIESLRISERFREVMKAIESLDEIYRTVLLYRYAYNMSASEIAEHLGISVKTVYTRLSRGKQELVARLKKGGV